MFPANLCLSWASENNIVNGIGVGLFGSNSDVTRQDIAVLFLRYLNYMVPELAVTSEYKIFADEDDISDYAKEAIQTLNKLGVILGKGENTVDPQGNTTRAELAALLHRIDTIIKEYSDLDEE